MNSTAGPPALFPGPDEDWGYKLKAVFLSTFIAAGMATLARLYVRTRVVKNVGLDDWLMLLAVVRMPLSLGCESRSLTYFV